MSRGSGRVERAIAEAIAFEPHNAFTVEDLGARVYPGFNRSEKKHRVAIGRSIRRLLSTRPELATLAGETRGNPLVLYSRYNVQSYGMARQKADKYNSAWRLPPEQAEKVLAAELMRGGKHHRLVAEGGAWWRHTQLEIARRDGDTEQALKLQAQSEAEFQNWTSVMKR